MASSTAIFYGKKHNRLVDVTLLLRSYFSENNIVYIPVGDHYRCIIFSDVLPNVLKSVYIRSGSQEIEIPADQEAFVNILTGDLVSDYDSRSAQAERKLRSLHSQLKIEYGTFYDEYPEQKMAAMFLTGKETVLEIGGNIGRNSLIIASLLSDSRRLVTLESFPAYASQLSHNRDLNALNFYVENSALSPYPLVQYSWSTKPASQCSDPNWVPVPTITYEQLVEKYDLTFDTLVLDCEGAFCNILKDTPQILDPVKTVIMENDYLVLEDYQYVRSKLEERNFRCVYEMPLILDGRFADAFHHTRHFFYQVWQR